MLVLLLLVDMLALSLFVAAAALELLKTLYDAPIVVSSLFMLDCGDSLLGHCVVIVLFRVLGRVQCKSKEG